MRTWATMGTMGLLVACVIACGGPPRPATALPTTTTLPTSATGATPPTCPRFQVAICQASGGTGGDCSGYACVPTGQCEVDADCAAGSRCECSGVGEAPVCNGLPQAQCDAMRCGGRRCVAPGEQRQAPP